ncbi:LPS assembly lipoprotein LptE [Candidatus Omnitrophota bacterium]
MRRSRLLVSFLLSFLTVLAAGCGYTTRSAIVSRFQNIYVAQFVNKIDITQDSDVGNKYRIYRPMLETDITRAVINKYLLDGNLRPIKEESADVSLTGELVEFRKDPLKYTDNDEVEEYRVNVAVNLRLWDNKSNELVWEENRFTGDATYFTSYSRTETPTSESAAITEAITDLARRIVERTVEEW